MKDISLLENLRRNLTKSLLEYGEHFLESMLLLDVQLFKDSSCSEIFQRRKLGFIELDRKQMDLDRQIPFQEWEKQRKRKHPLLNTFSIECFAFLVLSAKDGEN